MGQPQPVREVRLRSGGQDVAVTPVIGAVLILAISILGIGGVLYWGAPTLERIQAGNSQTAIVGEMEDLRDATRELSVPDHSRFPTVVLPGGVLSLEDGTRIMVTANHDVAPYDDCDFHVTGWSDDDDVVSAPVPASCRPGSTVQVFAVSGSTVAPAAFEGDGSTRDWLWQLQNAACTLGGGVCAQSWLHSSDRVAWRQATSSGEHEVYLDSGAIFSNDAGTFFLEKEPLIGDSTFGGDYVGLWLRSLEAGSYTAITGAGSYQIYLSLLVNALRMDQSGVTSLRYDLAGDLAESWCNALLARNRHLPDADADGNPDSVYTQDGAMTCDLGAADGVRSVTFTKVDGPSTFTFRFLNAHVYASISL